MTTNQLNVLRDIDKEKLDLIRLALNHYDSPYVVQGQDALTVNRLSEFAANNVLFKPRTELIDNEVSATIYKYIRRYFDQAVTEELTYNLLDTVLSYNKLLTETIMTNSLSNVFNIKEQFYYELHTLPITGTNISNPTEQTYTVRIPYVNKTKGHREITFKLSQSNFINGRISNLNGTRDIITEFNLDTTAELDIFILGNPNSVKKAKIEYKGSNPVRFETGFYFNNLFNNVVSDMERYIGNMSVKSKDVRDMLLSVDSDDYVNIDDTINSTIDGTSVFENVRLTYRDLSEEANVLDKELAMEADLDAILSAKKLRLRNKLESMKIDGDIRDMLIWNVLKYVQDEIIPVEDFTKPTKFKVSSINYINKDIIYNGDSDEQIKTLINNSYNPTFDLIEEDDRFTTAITAFESFLTDLFSWTYNNTTPETEPDPETKLTRTESISSIINRYVNTANESNELIYQDEIETILTTHIRIFYLKHYFLLDIRTSPYNTSPEKTSVTATYESEQISKDSPYTVINVIHKISQPNQDRFLALLEDYYVTDLADDIKWSQTGNNKNFNGNAFNLTFVYKETNEEIYKLFMQDQVETIIASWIVKMGDRDVLMSDMFADGFNNSAFAIALGNDVDLFTLVDAQDINYYKRAKSLVGNPTNYRLKDSMEIVGYFLDVYNEKYYGKTTEEKQEIALFLRSYLDVRNYYYKNLLLKSLEAGEAYPVLEFVLLIAMAFDRFFNKKIAKHADIDTYSTEDVNNFLDSFGLSELNEYEDFYDSFDYKLAVVRNYNNLIKNKGTRRVKPLIEDMLNSVNEQYRVELDEYYLVKDTRESVGYVDEYYKYIEAENEGEEGVHTLYKWDGTEWVSSTIGDEPVDPIGMYYSTVSGKLYVYETNDYEEYTIETGTNLPGVPSDNAIENIYFYNTVEEAVYKYEDDVSDWVITDIGGSANTETFTYTDSEGQLVETISASWLDTEEMLVYTRFYNEADDLLFVTRPVYDIPSGIDLLDPEDPEDPWTTPTPETIGKMRYNPNGDKFWFISTPEGSTSPISTVKRKMQANQVVDYRTFIEDDKYWDPNISESFMGDVNGINLNYAKTKYMSMSATINMETVRIMNSYIISILDNIIGNTKSDIVVESYSDQNISNFNDIDYKKLMDHIKFMYAHMHQLYAPEEVALFKDPDTEVEGTYDTFYGVPTPDELTEVDEVTGKNRIDSFVDELKKIITGNITEAEIDEFLFDKINGSEQLSMNRYKYETNIDNEIVLNPNAAEEKQISITKRTTVENNFVTKLRKMLLAIGYSNSEFKNSARFIIDFLTSTNLLTIIEDDDIEDDEYISNTKTKYIDILQKNNINTVELDITSLYNVNLQDLLQFLIDYTENTIFREEYIMKESNISNTLAINSTFFKIVDLIIKTFFERPSNLFYVESYEDFAADPDPTDPDPIEPTEPADMQDFLKEFIEDYKNVSAIPEERLATIVKYNNILGSLFKILETMLNSNDLTLLKTVYTYNKNFSSEDYFDFLISMLSFFMSYKVTLYEDTHQFDLTNQKETFIFAEDLTIYSEAKYEDDWFFDEEIKEIT